MSEQAQTPVAEAPVSPSPVPSAVKPGPADDLRNIQALLVNGMFPGSIAPQIMRSFNILEQMAQKIEKEAGYVPAK